MVAAACRARPAYCSGAGPGILPHSFDGPTMPPRPKPASRWLAPVLLLLVSLGFAAAWILLSASFNRPLSPMAVVAGIDAAVLLRFARFPRGGLRITLAVLATALSIAAACWGIAAARIGASLGLMPWESMLKMGPEFGWLLVRLGNGPMDLAWFAAGLIVAAIASR